MKTTDQLLKETIANVKLLKEWAQADADNSWDSDALDQAVDNENRVKILNQVLIDLSYCYKGV